MPRVVGHLSPSSLATFESDPQEFYLIYIADKRPPKLPQTQPMSVGSAFDAYAKSYLYERLFGKGHNPKFEFQAIFEAQVEQHNRDWAIEAGKHAFDCYKGSGALADLMLELSNAVGTPKFEFEVKGTVEGQREGVTLQVENMVLLGKPDVHFFNKHGAHVILDWKVNGFCSKYAKSPMPGYLKYREKGSNRGQHKDCHLMMHNGMWINAACYLEYLDTSWATQLSTYGWLCGEEVGSDFIVGIDQLCCQPSGIVNKPQVRVAEHRLRVSVDFQFQALARYQQAWQIIHSDHFFRDLSLEESIARCKALDGAAEACAGDGTDFDQWFSETTRAH